MFQSAFAQRRSQLSSRRWRSKDICQVSFTGNLAYAILVLHAQIRGKGCFYFWCMFTPIVNLKDWGSHEGFFFFYILHPQHKEDVVTWNPSINTWRRQMILFTVAQSTRCKMTQTWMEGLQLDLSIKFGAFIQKRACCNNCYIHKTRKREHVWKQMLVESEEGLSC